MGKIECGHKKTIVQSQLIVKIQTPNPVSTKELPENTVDQHWLEGDISRLQEYEPYDWGNVDPLTLGKPVNRTQNSELRTQNSERPKPEVLNLK